MSIHELFTIEIGGLDEEDDPYQEQRDHLYSISEEKIDKQDNSSGDEGDIEDEVEDRMLNYVYTRHHLTHSWRTSIANVIQFCLHGPVLKPLPPPRRFENEHAAQQDVKINEVIDFQSVTQNTTRSFSTDASNIE